MIDSITDTGHADRIGTRIIKQLMLRYTKALTT
jgi:hypothetical protein